MEGEILFELLDPIFTVGPARVRAAHELDGIGETGDHHLIGIAWTLEQASACCVRPLPQCLPQADKPARLTAPDRHGRGTFRHINPFAHPPPRGLGEGMKDHPPEGRRQAGHDDIGELQAFQKGQEPGDKNPASAQTNATRWPGGRIMSVCRRNSTQPLAVPACHARSLAHTRRRASLRKATKG